jgi:putative ABC transport system permease protein
MSLVRRLMNVFRAGGVDRALDEEMQFHIDERIRELVASGMTADVAAEHVRRRFGNRLRLREESRDIKLMPRAEAVVRDLRLGLRTLRKQPLVTATALVSLTLALGACMAAFSLVDALILQPLPVRDPEQLVHLGFPTYTPDRPEADTFNDPTFIRLRQAGRGTVDLFAMSTQVVRTAVVAPGEQKERWRTQYVSGDAFEQLGVLPAVGRMLSTQDDDRAAPPVAVIGHAFWLRRFGGDSGIVGQAVAVGGTSFQIVGVADGRFTGVEPGRPTDVWLPYATYDARAMGNPSYNWFRIMGRVAAAGRTDQARAVLQSAFTAFRREHAPRLFSRTQSPELVRRYTEAPLYVRTASTGVSPLRRQFQRPLLLLASLAGLVLLIAGSNIATLLLARSAAREREMLLRLSIGAGRAQLVQQAVAESAIVAGAASLLGVLFAAAVGPAIVATLGSTSDPLFLDLRPNWRLAACAAVLAIVVTLLFGLAPALRISRGISISSIATRATSGRAARTMRPYVALQSAFAMVVLSIGGMLVLSFARLSSVDPGFSTANVLLVSLESVQRVDPKQYRAALQEVLDRLEGMPGVASVSSAEFNLLGRAWTHEVPLPGTQYDTIETTVLPVTPGFFETMTIPILAGRGFNQRDMRAEHPEGIIVNDAFAARYFAGGPAVGRRVHARMSDDDQGVHEVIGVAANTRYALREAPAPTIYIPLRWGTTGTIHVRVTGDPRGFSSLLGEHVRSASPVFRVAAIAPQSQIVDRTLLRERLLAVLSGFFASVGLSLAAVGLYGLLSYAVLQRRREIGIRIALGARTLPVVRLVMGALSRTVAFGMAIGWLTSLYLSRYIESFLFEVTALDAWTIVPSLTAASLATLAAATAPAIRAARVDPVVALRYE